MRAPFNLAPGTPVRVLNPWSEITGKIVGYRKNRFRVTVAVVNALKFAEDIEVPPSLLEVLVSPGVRELPASRCGSEDTARLHRRREGEQ
jgi:hypothetical protein